MEVFEVNVERKILIPIMVLAAIEVAAWLSLALFKLEAI